MSSYTALKMTNKHEIDRIIKEQVNTVFEPENKQWFLKDTLDGISVFTDNDQVCIGTSSTYISVTQAAKISKQSWTADIN